MNTFKKVRTYFNDEDKLKKACFVMSIVVIAIPLIAIIVKLV